MIAVGRRTFLSLAGSGTLALVTRGGGTPSQRLPVVPTVPIRPSGVALSTTSEVYPTRTSHPGAVFSRAGSTLSSTGRRSLPVYDNADGFVLGTTEPTWANSGCRIPQAQLTRVTANNLVTSSDGQVISGLHLPTARIELRHKNVTIRDCIINIGNPAGRSSIHGNPGITANPSYDTSGAKIEFVTIDPVGAGAGGATDDAAVNGVYAIAATIYRCAIRRVTDACAPDVNTFSSEPSHIWGSYLETRYLPYDPQQSDGTHNDCIQFAGGDGNTVIGNALHNPTATNSNGIKGQCVVLTPYHRPTIVNVTISKNWMYGAYTQIAAWPPWSQGGPGILGLTIEGNRHGGTCVWPILCSPTSNDARRSIAGNVAGAAGLTWNNGTAKPAAPIATTVAANNQGPGL